MPNHVINELIFRNVDNTQQNAIIAILGDSESCVDFKVLVPPPLNVWPGNVGLKHEKAFGESGCSLNWCRQEWGTKWNAYGNPSIERTDDTLIVRFKTAWSPPYRWLLAVFNLTKRSFEHNWLSEGNEHGISGIWNRAALESDSLVEEAWLERDCDETMQRHLHTLLWGVETFDDEDNKETEH